MALRANVAGRHQRETSATTDLFSVCGWASRLTDTAGRQYILWIASTDATTGFDLDNTGHAIFIENGDEVQGSCAWDTNVTATLHTTTDSSWFFWCVKFWNDAGTRKARFGVAPYGGAITFATINQVDNFDALKFQIGAGANNFAPAYCDLEHVRAWADDLSDAEFTAEMASPTQVLATNEYAVFDYAADPTITDALLDGSGAGNNMTAFGASLSVNTNAPVLTSATGPILSGSDSIPSTVPAGSLTAPTLGSVTSRTYQGGTFSLSGLGSNRARIYGRTSSGGTRQLLVETAPGATSVQVTALLPKTAYWIDATAYDGSTESSYSTSQTFTTRNLRIRMPILGAANVGLTLDGFVAQLPSTGQIIGEKIDDVTGTIVAASGGNSEFLADLLPVAQFRYTLSLGANYACAIRNATLGTWVAWTAVVEEV